MNSSVESFNAFYPTDRWLTGRLAGMVWVKFRSLGLGLPVDPQRSMPILRQSQFRLSHFGAALLLQRQTKLRQTKGIAWSGRLFVLVDKRKTAKPLECRPDFPTNSGH